MLFQSIFWVMCSWAEPASDPQYLLIERLARGQPVFRGVGDRSPLVQARWISGIADPSLDDLFSAERQFLEGTGTISDAWIAQGGRLAVGTQSPEYNNGDPESGLVSARWWVSARAYSGKWAFSLKPEILGDAGGDASVGLGVSDLWVSWHHGGIDIGAGVRERFIGPGRHAGLMLTDNAAAAPLLDLAWESQPLGRFGRIRAEAGAGWMDRERSDVQHPGWLLMDFRWLPVPAFEMGLTRVGLFGGEGRPSPPLGQLIIPTDPHVYDDPNKVEPDQDEMAALDARLTVPFNGLIEGVDFVEVWWQYGGEDVIGSDFQGIPYPSLAGIANLYGAEVGIGSWILMVESVRVLDDYFRWYTGHRVYHDGFTQEGRSMGYAPGGDSLGMWGAVTWLPGEHGLQVEAERLTRVGVVESRGANLLALSTDEEHRRLGVSGWKRHAHGWWQLTVSVDSVTGVDFLPGATERQWRISLTH